MTESSKLKTCTIDFEIDKYSWNDEDYSAIGHFQLDQVIHDGW